jgi:FixJ family two-component response regulator
MEGFRIEGFAGAETFFEYADENPLSCVVLDMKFPTMSGLQIQAELLERDIDCPIVFLSGQSNISMSVEAMRAGAFEFLEKPVDTARLIDAVIAAVHSHSTRIDSQYTLAALLDRWESLTRREQEVCRCVVAGQLNKEIAASLGTAEKTIKVHRGRVMRKMRARRVTDLVRMTEKLASSMSLP